MIRISVVMSVFAEPIDWIKQSVDSILCQTFGDYEFIIVNDKPDREELKELLDDYSRRDSRIVVISNEENIGLTKSLNKALSIANGKYIARMDADDYSHPLRFEKQLSFLEGHKDVVMIGCYARIMNESGRIIGKMYTSDDYETLKMMIPFSQPTFHPSMMYLKEINGFPVRYDEEMRMSQDYELCSRLIDYPLTNIPEFLIDYRMSAKQMTKVYKANYITKDGPIRKNLLCKYYNGITDKDADSFINMFYRLKVDRTAIEDVDTFLVHLYQNNNNHKKEIKTVMTFVLIRYIKFLLHNETKTNVIRRFVRLNKSFEDSFYMSVFGYGIGKILNKLKYKLIYKKCPAYK